MKTLSLKVLMILTLLVVSNALFAHGDDGHGVLFGGMGVEEGILLDGSISTRYEGLYYPNGLNANAIVTQVSTRLMNKCRPHDEDHDDDDHLEADEPACADSDSTVFTILPVSFGLRFSVPAESTVAEIENLQVDALRILVRRITLGIDTLGYYQTHFHVRNGLDDMKIQGLRVYNISYSPLNISRRDGRHQVFFTISTGLVLANVSSSYEQDGQYGYGLVFKHGGEEHETTIERETNFSILPSLQAGLSYIIASRAMFSVNAGHVFICPTGVHHQGDRCMGQLTYGISLNLRLISGLFLTANYNREHFFQATPALNRSNGHVLSTGLQFNW